MGTILSMRFYDRPTRAVARDLLGKALVRRTNGETVRLLITEVEAYDGPSDLASHASRGATRRTEVMFGPAGRWYVYFIYGMHEMLNVVTGTTGYPAAVLIRGTADVSGPGRLTRHFKVSRAHNAKPASRSSGLWIEDAGIRVPRNQIKTTPRIGVDYAGPVWSKKHYRYVWRRNDPRILRG